jgi:predicted nucleic acid-binding protein
VKAYIDSSVVLRIVFAQPGRLQRWRQITEPVSSELIRVECLRAIDRARIRAGLDDAAVALRHAVAFEHLTAIRKIPLERRILERAAEPFPTALGSLDALHLASALAARREIRELVFATHDRELATAARAVGFEVLA